MEVHLVFCTTAVLFVPFELVLLYGVYYDVFVKECIMMFLSEHLGFRRCVAMIETIPSLK